MEADEYAQLSVEEVKDAVESGDLTAEEAVRLEQETGKNRKGVLSLTEDADSDARRATERDALEKALAAIESGRPTEIRDTPQAIRRRLAELG